MHTYIFVLLGSLAVASLLTPAVIWFARIANLLDRPGTRTIHTRPVARIGGVAIFVSAVSTVIIAAVLDQQIARIFRSSQRTIIWTAIAASMVFVLGLIDDIRGLSAKTKFLAESAAAIAIISAGVRISKIEIADNIALDLGHWSWPVTWLWVVGLTNAINISDGLDGLACGVSAVACLVIATMSLLCGNVLMAILTLALLGGLCGFLIHNFYPAKIFMGDCGSLFVGFAIASSSILCLAKSSTMIGLGLPMLALGVPIFDTICAILRRYLERRSVFSPDRCHIHHRLLDLGLSHRQAVLAIYAAASVLAGVGLLVVLFTGRAILVMACGITILVLLFRVCGMVRFGCLVSQARRKCAYARQQRHARRTFEEIELRLRQVSNLQQWWQAICQAGKRFGFDSIQLVIKGPDDGINKFSWSTSPSDGLSKDTTQHVTFGLVLAADRNHGCTIHCRVVVQAQPCLEWAADKAALFGRLMDAYPPSSHIHQALHQVQEHRAIKVQHRTMSAVQKVLPVSDT